MEKARRKGRIRTTAKMKLQKMEEKVQLPVI